MLLAVNASLASGRWVPRGQVAATSITPQGGRTPTGLPTCNPATSPPAPSPPAPVALRPEALEVKWKTPRRGEDPKPRKWRVGGEPREMLRYCNRTPHLQRRHLPRHAQKCDTGGQESAPMLTNNGKRCKC